MRTIRTLLLTLVLFCLGAAPALAGGAPNIDDDGDGFCEVSCADGSEPGDCDDDDPDINPVDIDGDGSDPCDAMPDCDETDVDLHGRDDDGDGVTLCDEVPDCDDTVFWVSPNVIEYADGLDNDCDGDIDEEMDEVDDDGDGQTEAEGDCDDTDEFASTGEYEFCDNQDNDCDGLVDADDADYGGDDSDGDGDAATACGGSDCRDNDPEANGLDLDGDGESLCQLDPDCDDNNADVYPGNEEVCIDGLDNDCSGVVDDIDLDGDGAISPDCGGDDCDEGNVAIHPGIEETGASCLDQIDNDCDCTGDTNGDGIECGRGDEGVDGLDEECYALPDVDGGVDQQDRYLGGTSIVVLDGSGTTDDNPDDVLSFTWTVEPLEDYSGVTWELIGEPTSPYGYLRFHADASDTQQWVFVATLEVDDGLSEPDPDDEVEPPVTVEVTFFRPSVLARIDCAMASVHAPSALAVLLGIFGLVAVRRRRVA